MKPTTHCPDGYATCAVHNIRDCDAGGRCRKHLQPPRRRVCLCTRSEVAAGRPFSACLADVHRAAALDTEGNDHG